MRELRSPSRLINEQLFQPGDMHEYNSLCPGHCESSEIRYIFVRLCESLHTISSYI